MNALSLDLRSRIVRFYEVTPQATYAQAANHFMVGVATVSRLIRHWRRTGSVAVTPPSPKKRTKIDIDWLREQLKDGVDKRLKDLVFDYARDRNINVAVSSIWYALKSLDISHKKNGFRQRKRI